MNFKLCKGSLVIFCTIFIALLAGCPISVVDDITPPPPQQNTAPGVMLAPTLEAGNGQLTAAWAAPEYTGSSAITEYHLRHSADGASKWTLINFGIGLNTRHIIRGLTNGAMYFVQVRAVNSDGAGEWSPLSERITPATVPSKMSAPDLRVGNSQLTATWTAPDNGGNAIIRYEVQYRASSPQGQWTTSTSVDVDVTDRSHTVTGLNNETPYEVQVRAVNSVTEDAGNGPGVGAWSTSTTATPINVPLVPNGLMLAVGNGQLTATWTAPSGTVDSYTLQYHAVTTAIPAGSWTDSTVKTISGITSTSQVITPLINGTEYAVRVYAVNAQGEGNPSEPAVATPATVPAAPAIPTLTVGNSRLIAAWTAPTNNGGSTVTGYELQYRKGSSGAWTFITTGISGTSHPITGLDNGDSYSVQVRAKNAQGWGAWSGSATATPAPVPGAPAKPTLTAGNGELEVSWTAPSDTGGSAVTEYHLQYSDDGVDWLLIDSGIIGTSRTITGLTNGTTYYVRVRAVNAVDPGLWSLAAEAIPVTVPKTMSAPTLTVGNARLTVRWTALTAPADTGGSAITAYHLRYRKGSGLWSYITSGIGTNTNHPITGLTNGSSYSVQVRAKNAVGEGGWSGSVIATPSTTPSTPNAPTLVLGNGRLTVSWTAPHDGGSPITAYHLSYRRVGTTPWTYILTGIGTNTSHTITGLTNGQEYEVDVRAKNARGESNWSQVAKATPSTVPLKPADPTVTPGDRRLTVSWSAPNDGGSPITGYDLQYRKGSGAWTPINSGITGTSHIITGLINGSGYSVQVRARNVRGDGAWSDSATATPAAAPAKPNTPTVKVGNGKLKVSWTAPSNGGSAILGYDMRYWSHGFQGYTYISTGPTITSHTITGLVNGRSYSAQVRARNAIGWSDFSNTVVSQPLSILRNTANVSDTSIRELNGARGVTTAVVGGNTYLFVAGYDDDGVNMFTVNDNGTLSHKDLVQDGGSLELNGANSLTTAVISGKTYLFVTALHEDSFSVFEVDGTNEELVYKTNAQDNGTQLDGAFGIATAVVGGTTYAIVSGFADDGVSVFSVNIGSGNSVRLSNEFNRSDPTQLNGAAGMTTTVINNKVLLYVAAAHYDGVNVLRVDAGGRLTFIDAFSDTSSRKLDGALYVETAVVGGTTYLFVAGEADNAVSVFRAAGTNGAINEDSPADQVVDNSTLELAGATGLTTAVVGGTTYLFVAGDDDDGVSVFSVASNGNLTNIDNVRDNSTLELSGAYGATTAVVNGVTYLFVAGNDDDGVSVFAVDPTGLW